MAQTYQQAIRKAQRLAKAAKVELVMYARLQGTDEYEQARWGELYDTLVFWQSRMSELQRQQRAASSTPSTASSATGTRYTFSSSHGGNY